MDLIYADKLNHELGIMKDFDLDLAFGSDENDFQLTTHTNNHVCDFGYLIYIDGTEYGGIIDSIEVNTKTDDLIYKGLTWHGVMEQKIVEPDPQQDYLILSGDLKTILNDLIKRVHLDSLFKVGSVPNIEVKKHQVNRYITLYECIKNLLDGFDCKFKLVFNRNHVDLIVEPKVDYTKNEQFDSKLIDFKIEKKFKPINHVICLGKGNLKDRTVIHLYANEKGNVTEKQHFFNLDEVTYKYDYSSSESEEELINGGIKIMKESWNSSKIQIDLKESKFDVGDVVGAKENITGLFVSKQIVKKIVKIKNDEILIEHKVGDY